MMNDTNVIQPRNYMRFMLQYFIVGEPPWKIPVGRETRRDDVEHVTSNM